MAPPFPIMTVAAAGAARPALVWNAESGSGYVGKLGCVRCQYGNKETQIKATLTLLTSALAASPRHEAKAHGTANQDRNPSIFRAYVNNVDIVDRSRLT